MQHFYLSCHLICATWSASRAEHYRLQVDHRAFSRKRAIDKSANLDRRTFSNPHHSYSSLVMDKNEDTVGSSFSFDPRRRLRPALDLMPTDSYGISTSYHSYDKAVIKKYRESSSQQMNQDDVPDCSLKWTVLCSPMGTLTLYENCDDCYGTNCSRSELLVNSSLSFLTSCVSSDFIFECNSTLLLRINCDTRQSDVVYEGSFCDCLFLSPSYLPLSYSYHAPSYSHYGLPKPEDDTVICDDAQYWTLSCSQTGRLSLREGCTDCMPETCALSTQIEDSWLYFIESCDWEGGVYLKCMSHKLVIGNCTAGDEFIEDRGSVCGCSDFSLDDPASPYRFQSFSFSSYSPRPWVFSDMLDQYMLSTTFRGHLSYDDHHPRYSVESFLYASISYNTDLIADSLGHSYSFAFTDFWSADPDNRVDTSFSNRGGLGVGVDYSFLYVEASARSFSFDAQGSSLQNEDSRTHLHSYTSYKLDHLLDHIESGGSLSFWSTPLSDNVQSANFISYTYDSQTFSHVGDGAIGLHDDQAGCFQKWTVLCSSTGRLILFEDCDDCHGDNCLSSQPLANSWLSFVTSCASSDIIFECNSTLLQTINCDTMQSDEVPEGSFCGCSLSTPTYLPFSFSYHTPSYSQFVLSMPREDTVVCDDVPYWTVICSHAGRLTLLEGCNDCMPETCALSTQLEDSWLSFVESCDWGGGVYLTCASHKLVVGNCTTGDEIIEDRGSVCGCADFGSTDPVSSYRHQSFTSFDVFDQHVLSTSLGTSLSYDAMYAGYTDGSFYYTSIDYFADPVAHSQDFSYSSEFTDFNSADADITLDEGFSKGVSYRTEFSFRPEEYSVHPFSFDARGFSLGDEDFLVHDHAYFSYNLAHLPDYTESIYTWSYWSYSLSENIHSSNIISYADGSQRFSYFSNGVIGLDDDEPECSQKWTVLCSSTGRLTLSEDCDDCYGTNCSHSTLLTDSWLSFLTSCASSDFFFECDSTLLQRIDCNTRHSDVVSEGSLCDCSFSAPTYAPFSFSYHNPSYSHYLLPTREEDSVVCDDTHYWKVTCSRAGRLTLHEGCDSCMSETCLLSTSVENSWLYFIESCDWDGDFYVKCMSHEFFVGNCTTGDEIIEHRITPCGCSDFSSTDPESFSVYQSFSFSYSIRPWSFSQAFDQYTLSTTFGSPLSYEDEYDRYSINSFPYTSISHQASLVVDSLDYSYSFEGTDSRSDDRDIRLDSTYLHSYSYGGDYSSRRGEASLRSLSFDAQAFSLEYEDVRAEIYSYASFRAAHMPDPLDPGISSSYWNYPYSDNVDSANIISKLNEASFSFLFNPNAYSIFSTSVHLSYAYSESHELAYSSIFGNNQFDNLSYALDNGGFQFSGEILEDSYLISRDGLLPSHSFHYATAGPTGQFIDGGLTNEPPSYSPINDIGVSYQSGISFDNHGVGETSYSSDVNADYQDGAGSSFFFYASYLQSYYHEGKSAAAFSSLLTNSYSAVVYTSYYRSEFAGDAILSHIFKLMDPVSHGYGHFMENLTGGDTRVSYEYGGLSYEHGESTNDSAASFNYSKMYSSADGAFSYAYEGDVNSALGSYIVEAYTFSYAIESQAYSTANSSVASLYAKDSYSYVHDSAASESESKSYGYYSTAAPTTSVTWAGVEGNTSLPTKASTPSIESTTTPISEPSSALAPQPTPIPTRSPSIASYSIPSGMLTVSPTITPSTTPTNMPSPAPKALPSFNPTDVPTSIPQILPAVPPTLLPTVSPSSNPTAGASLVQSILFQGLNVSQAENYEPVFVSAFAAITSVNADAVTVTFALTEIRRRLSTSTSIIATFTVLTPRGSAEISRISQAMSEINTIGVNAALADAAPFSAVSLFSGVSAQSISEVSVTLNTPMPTLVPSITAMPSSPPSSRLTSKPSSSPTSHPSQAPSRLLTSMPTQQPIPPPSLEPTHLPSRLPHPNPTSSPTQIPSSAHPTAQACSNGAKDGDETDVDCGGSDCRRCGIGLACLKDSDCAMTNGKQLICIESTCSAQPTSLPTICPTSTPTEIQCERLAQPPTPEVALVRFTSTGAQLEIDFNRATDRGGISATHFACSRVVNIEGSSSASCSWLSDQRLVATLGSSATVAPGDLVSIIRSVVRAKCAYLDCSCWNATSSTQVSILSPSPPVLVTATVEAPSFIGACSPLELSAAASSGDGGRNLIFAWNATIVSSRVAPDSANCSIALLDALATFSRAAVFVMSSMEKCVGNSIEFAVVVSNFFGESSMAINRVSVLPGTAPEVKIVGGSVLTTFASRTSQIRAIATASRSCDGTTKSGVELSFSWVVVYKAAGSSAFVEAPFTSSRTDRRIFELAAYSVKAADVLQFEVTVKESPTGTNNTAMATLTVLPSPIVAIISGGDRTVDASADVIVDASLSYNPDDLASGVKNLDFKWTCSNDAVDTSSTSSILILAPNTLSAVQSPYIFTVLVSDRGAIGRNATASVALVASAEPFVPDVSIASLATEKANPSLRLVLQGSVERSSDLDTYATWSLLDGSELVDGVALANVARTGLTTLIAKSSVSGTAIATLYLVLPASISLVPGATYNFILRVTSAADGTELGKSSVTVAANASPVPGVVEVDPKSGTVLSTTYTIMASHWSDDATDYPLLYTFLTSTTVLREATLSPRYPGVVLPQGTGPNSTVLCSARVSDQLGATASATTSVVNLPEAGLMAAALANATESLLGAAASTEDTELIFQVAGAVASMLQSEDNGDWVECTRINCSMVLGRETCKDGESLCGDCMPPLVGDKGPSMEPCAYPIENCLNGIHDENETDVDCGGPSACARCATESSCIADSDCVSGRCQSSRGTCGLPIKTCGGGCGSNGTCIHVDSLGNQIDAEECDESNAFCDPKCECSLGFYGSTCAFDEDGWASQRSLRGTILSALLDTAENMDPTADASNMQASTVASLTNNPEALTAESAGAAARILEIATNASAANGFDGADGTESHLANAISNIMQSGRVADADTGSLLDTFGESALVGTVAGEKAANACAGAFCMASSRTAASNLPETTFESPGGIGPGVSCSVETGTDSGRRRLDDGDQNDVDITLVEFASVRNDESAVSRQSSVCRIRVANSIAARRRLLTDATTVVTLTLQNYVRVSYPETNASDTIDCAGVEGPVAVNCSGVVSKFNCSAYESLVNPCNAIAACRAWDQRTLTWDSRTCDVVNFTAYNTTCRCEIGSTKAETASNAEFTSTSELVAREVASIFKQNPFADPAQTALVLIVFGIIALSCFAAASWGLAQDKRDRGRLASGKAVVGEGGSVASTLSIKEGTLQQHKSSLALKVAAREAAINALNESLPLWVREQGALRNYIRRLFEHHNLLDYLVYDSVLSRPMRALKLYTGYCWVLASEAVLFMLCFPDLGCDDYDNEEDCLKPDSPYFPSVPACQWQPNVDPQCSLNATKGATLSTYIILVLTIAFVLAPIAMAIDVIFAITSAPVSDQSRSQRKQQRIYVYKGEDDDEDKVVKSEGQVDNEIEAACRRDLDLELRVNVLYASTSVALRSRHHELLEAAKAGDDVARRMLVPFERRYGFRRKYAWTWRMAFFVRETDEERFERKIRRMIRRDLKRADVYDDELQRTEDESDRSRQITEFARLEQLTLIEQRIYLKNKFDKDKAIDNFGATEKDDPGRDRPAVSRSGHRLATVVLFIMIAFPMYITLAVFSVLTQRSKPLANGWLQTVCIFLILDTFIYTPLKIAVVFVYFPSLIKVKLRSLGDPIDNTDSRFRFKTPLFAGAIDYVAARHSKRVSMASLILSSHFLARDEQRENAKPNDDARPRVKESQRTFEYKAPILKVGNEVVQQGGAAVIKQKKPDKDKSVIDPNNMRQILSLHFMLATFFLVVWSTVILLPDGVQELVVTELIVFSVNMLILGLIAGLGEPLEPVFKQIAALGVVPLIAILLSILFLLTGVFWLAWRRASRAKPIQVRPSWLLDDAGAQKRVLNKSAARTGPGRIWDYCEEKFFDAFYETTSVENLEGTRPAKLNENNLSAHSLVQPFHENVAPTSPAWLTPKRRTGDVVGADPANAAENFKNESIEPSSIGGLEDDAASEPLTVLQKTTVEPLLPNSTGVDATLAQPMVLGKKRLGNQLPPIKHRPKLNLQTSNDDAYDDKSEAVATRENFFSP